MKKLSKKEKEEFAKSVEEFNKCNTITFSEFLDEIIETKKKQEQEKVANFSNSKKVKIPVVARTVEDDEKEREEFLKNIDEYIEVFKSGDEIAFSEFLERKSLDKENNSSVNFSSLIKELDDINFSLSWDEWRNEQLQQIEELEKDLPEFKENK